MTGEVATEGAVKRPVSWHRIDQTGLPPDGRARTVLVDGRSVAVSRCAGRLGALV